MFEAEKGGAEKCWDDCRGAENRSCDRASEKCSLDARRVGAFREDQPLADDGEFLKAVTGEYSAVRFPPVLYELPKERVLEGVCQVC